jgi:abequosyltransferase
MPPAVWDDLTIAVPVYARPDELRQLLGSIAAMAVLPGEVLLCEDQSRDRPLLRQIAADWTNVLSVKGCTVSYNENARNLGYDGNVRNLFSKATRPWVLLLGNDDAMLPNSIPAIERFISENPDVQMMSRTFVRFRYDIENVVGVTRLSYMDRVFTKNNAKAGMIVRLCGFVGGLLVNRAWAVSLATTRYDGTLYYQMYLAAVAFSGYGIGYIAEPLVASRTGGAPLFGSAASEKGNHAPGAYSPRARGAMWEGILRICADVESRTSVPLVKCVRRELSGRQSFHVFEFVAVQGRYATLELVREFHRLGLMNHPLPWALAGASLVLGRRIRHLFGAVRAAQKWLATRGRSGAQERQQ